MFMRVLISVDGAYVPAPISCLGACPPGRLPGAGAGCCDQRHLALGAQVGQMVSRRVSPACRPEERADDRLRWPDQAASGWRLGLARNNVSQPGSDGAEDFVRVRHCTWRAGAGHPVGDHRDAREELAISRGRGADDEDTGPPGKPRIIRHLPIVGQRASLRCVRCDQWTHELIHCPSRGEVQLAAELSLIILVMLHRGSPVALGEVNADDDPMCALAEQFGPGRHEARL